jgi:hypothetical protein
MQTWNGNTNGEERNCQERGEKGRKAVKAEGQRELLAKKEALKK